MVHKLPTKPSPHIFMAGKSVPSDVFLDGQIIKNVRYADTEIGIVCVMNKPVRVDAATNEVETTTLHGKVEVRPKITNKEAA